MNDEEKTDRNQHLFIGEWLVDPDAGEMRRGQDTRRLEPKVTTVLMCLAERAGEVVSREELEARAWAGMVVGYDSLASTIIKLRKAFSDEARKPNVIETVPKKGYRLIAPVRREDIESDAPVSGPLPSPRKPARKLLSRDTWIAMALSVVLAAAGLPLWYSSEKTEPPEPGEAAVQGSKPAVAVLPFTNLSNDPEQDYFSDGITMDLITDLSRVSGLHVIARNSAFAYRDRDVDARRIGEELGVTYLIEGSVQKAGRQVRISARLIDTRSGYHLWAERFDGTLEDVFALQDEVISKIVSSLAVTLTTAERVRIAHKYTNSVDAYDNFLQGWQHFWEFSREGNQQAREYLLKAIELDPEFARAYANLAMSYTYDFVYGWSDTADQSLDLAVTNARKAEELDDDLPQVHWARGLTLQFSKKPAEAIRSIEKAIELDPNFADGYGLLASTLNFAGRPDQALEVMQQAMRLNPRYPFIYEVILGEIHFNLRDYNQAIDQFTSALARNPQAQEPRLWLAAAYAHTDRMDAAQWQLEEVRISDPQVSVERIERTIPFSDPGQRKHLVDGLYKAGLRN